MRRRSRRQVEIFSISALDLFASALGAFILVTIILFPYYDRGQASGGPLPNRTVSRTRSRRGPTSRRPSDIVHARPDSVARAGCRYRSPCDGSAGREFYWYKSNRGGADYPGSEATLSFDMIGGPAIELWQATNPEPGTYQVDYVANALPRAPASRSPRLCSNRVAGTNSRPHTARREAARAAATVVIARFRRCRAPLTPGGCADLTGIRACPPWPSPPSGQRSPPSPITLLATGSRSGSQSSCARARALRSP